MSSADAVKDRLTIAVSEWMRYAKVTPTSLHKQTGISRDAFYRMQKGAGFPSLDTLVAFADVVQTTPAALLQGALPPRAAPKAPSSHKVGVRKTSRILAMLADLDSDDVASTLGVPTHRVEAWKSGAELIDGPMLFELAPLLDVSLDEIAFGPDRARSRYYQQFVVEAATTGKVARPSDAPTEPPPTLRAAPSGSETGSRSEDESLIDSLVALGLRVDRTEAAEQSAAYRLSEIELSLRQITDRLDRLEQPDESKSERPSRQRSLQAGTKK